MGWFPLTTYNWRLKPPAVGPVVDKCIDLYYIVIVVKAALVWDKWNREHIKKHKVTITEVEEAYANEYGRSDSYEKRQSIYGITKKRRLITIVVSYAKQADPYVVSSRDTSKKEKRDYYEKS